MKAWGNIGLAVVFLFVLTAVPVMAEANIIEQYAFKWDFTPEDEWFVWNCVSGEDVLVWGTFHDQLLYVEDANGDFHWVNHWRAHGHGVGMTSGAQYIYKGGDREFINPDGGSHVWSGEDGSGSYASTGTKYMDLIGTGGVGSYRMRCISHTTINANGEMVTEFERCWIPCD